MVECYDRPSSREHARASAKTGVIGLCGRADAPPMEADRDGDGELPVDVLRRLEQVETVRDIAAQLDAALQNGPSTVR